MSTQNKWLCLPAPPSQQVFLKVFGPHIWRGCLCAQNCPGSYTNWKKQNVQIFSPSIHVSVNTTLSWHIFKNSKKCNNDTKDNNNTNKNLQYTLDALDNIAHTHTWTDSIHFPLGSGQSFLYGAQHYLKHLIFRSGPWTIKITFEDTKSQTKWWLKRNPWLNWNRAGYAQARAGVGDVQDLSQISP